MSQVKTAQSSKNGGNNPRLIRRQRNQFRPAAMSCVEASCHGRPEYTGNLRETGPRTGYSVDDPDRLAGGFASNFLRDTPQE